MRVGHLGSSGRVHAEAFGIRIIQNFPSLLSLPRPHSFVSFQLYPLSMLSDTGPPLAVCLASLGCVPNPHNAVRHELTLLPDCCTRPLRSSIHSFPRSCCRYLSPTWDSKGSPSPAASFPSPSKAHTPRSTSFEPTSLASSRTQSGPFQSSANWSKSSGCRTRLPWRPRRSTTRTTGRMSAATRGATGQFQTFKPKVSGH